MILDTSVLIEIFLHDEDSEQFNNILDKIQDEDLFISMIQIGEISDWSYRNGIDPKTVLSHIRSICEVLPMDEKMMGEASRWKHHSRMKGRNKFSLTDGIILATARMYSEMLLTKDNDFSGNSDVVPI